MLSGPDELFVLLFLMAFCTSVGVTVVLSMGSFLISLSICRLILEVLCLVRLVN